jgi:hypothetical protein
MWNWQPHHHLWAICLENVGAPWTPTVCYRDSFTFFVLRVIILFQIWNFHSGSCEEYCILEPDNTVSHVKNILLSLHLVDSEQSVKESWQINQVKLHMIFLWDLFFLHLSAEHFDEVFQPK